MKQQTLLSFFGKKKRSTDKENSAPKRAKPAAAEEAAASAPEAVVQETTTPAAAQDAPMTEAIATAQEEPKAAPDETEAEAPPAEEEAAAPPAEAKEPPAPAEAEEPPAPAEAAETEAPTSTPPANPQHAGLSQYEIERLERIARNAQFMASLGLGDARDAFAAPSGLGASTTTKKKAGRRKPKPSAPAGPRRSSPRLAGGAAPGAAAPPSSAAAADEAEAEEAPAEASRLAEYLVPAGAADVSPGDARELEDPGLKRVYGVAARGALVAAVGKGGRVAVFCPSAGSEPLAAFKGHGGWVGGCGFVGGDRLLTAANDGKLVLWDCAAARGDRLRDAATLAPGRCWSLAVSDDRGALCGFRDGTVGVVACAPAALTETVRIDVADGAVKGVAWRGDGTFATASDDGDVAGWDPRAAAAAAWRLAGAHAEATSAAFRPGDDHQVLTAGRDAAVKLWDLRAPGAPLRTFAGHHRPDARRKGIFHPRWVGGAAFAVGGEGSQRLAFYDAARGAAFASVKCAGDVTAVAPLPGGDALAVADDASGALALVPAPPRPSAP